MCLRLSPDRVECVVRRKRYSENGRAALQHLSFVLRPREKVALVGRTGAGKSSVGIALFRIVELSDGCIRIDGRDARSLGLDDLRRAVAVIPQVRALGLSRCRPAHTVVSSSSAFVCVTRMIDCTRTWQHASCVEAVWRCSHVYVLLVTCVTGATSLFVCVHGPSSGPCVIPWHLPFQLGPVR